ncbi:glutathione S-transferase family protein [Gammaproteobacteria bacterium LSUCC0112]|nr:glutathione S-transferase family protein [Gammaproteobacteria bacterium LSUCC0112]
MITVHHLRIGRSIFTVWLLEELGAAYELQVYLRDPATFRAPPSLKTIHPLGKSPVIVDDGQVIAESGAITSYLLEKFDTAHMLHPSRDDLKTWATFTQWLHYPEGSVFLPLLIKMLLLRNSQPHVALDTFSAAEIKLHLDHINQQLSDKPFILGEQFSGADIGITYVMSLAKRIGVLNDYPHLLAYLDRNTSRPAFGRAIERAVE